MAQSSNFSARARNDGELTMADNIRLSLTYKESWVEIQSQPSSSSLSSIGDEIVTTGLRVQHDPNIRRRRRVSTTLVPQAGLQPRNPGTSSQEEYDESESEEDRIMTSSNEHISPAPQQKATVVQATYDDGSDSDDDDENATALGRRTSNNAAFTPQPNAFSHPPTSQTQRNAVQGSYFPAQRSMRHERPAHNPRTPSYATDHDAALRASLTTLLSIGAAGRSLPKRDHAGFGRTIHSSEPMNLRFVPESELNNSTIPANTGRSLTPSTRARSSPSISSQDAIEHAKRKAVSTKPSSDKSRPTKKKKMQVLEGETFISPTMMAWFMSAGVVVLVSVVGFGAGYVIGREVGRQEVMAGLNGSSIADGGSCGREAVKSTASLRRFKWNVGSARSVVA